MNILLLSSIYPIPGPGNQGTKVCHFFAKEWLGMGHRVVAVHYQSTYPAPFYWAARLFRKKLAAKTGAVIYTKREKNPVHFEMNGVDVTRIPLYKPLPHGRYAQKSIKRSVDLIVTNNKAKGFVPDVIVGHFINPQLEAVNLLKEIYPNAVSGLVFHLPAEIDMAEKLYGNDLQALYEGINIFGFRNEPLKRYFEQKYCKGFKSFICYSGIPESYITLENKHHFHGYIHSFIFVGSLVERKYPAEVLDALHEVYPQGDYKMLYVGDGQQDEVIGKKAEQYGIKENVSLLGNIDRNKILNLYDQADCMIMISKGEAYGLVYLEAMARGCITIASKNEGMDGVIVDGVNGFLCEAGDYKMLANIIMRINALPNEEKNRISKNAIDTANKLTDYMAAKRYLNDLMK